MTLRALYAQMVFDWCSRSSFGSACFLFIAHCIGIMINLVMATVVLYAESGLCPLQYCIHLI